MIDATYAPSNTGDLTSTPARVHKCGPGGAYTFLLNAQEVTTVTNSGTTTNGTVDDFDTETITGASTRTDYIVDVEQLRPPSFAAKPVTVTSTDQSVIATPVDGTAVGVSNGKALIVAAAADGEVSAKRVSVSLKVGQTVTHAIAPSVGTLHKHCTDQIEDRIAGRGRDSMNLWSVRDNATKTYAWNPDCWGADLVNITCMSPYNTGTGNGGGGALITPRHVIFIHHLGFYPKAGAKIRYVTPSNVTEEFTVEAVKIHPKNAPYIMGPFDIVIAKLDRDVPSTIKIAKVFPANTVTHLPSLPSTYSPSPTHIRYSNGKAPWLRVCHTTQNKRLATAYLRSLPSGTIPPETQEPDYAYYAVGETSSGAYPISQYPDNPLGDPVVTGDSGAPAFAVVNNELVLLSLWSTPHSGFPYHTEATVINSMLDDLGGGYNLTEVDLTGFPTY